MGGFFFNLEESSPVLYVTEMNFWRGDSAMFDELETVNIARPWLSRGGLRSSLRAFLSLLLTMDDSMNLVVPKTASTLLNFEANRLHSFVRDVQRYFFLEQGCLYDHFEDVMVRAVRHAVHRNAGLFDVERVDPWQTAGEVDWTVFCDGWRLILRWT